MGVLVRAVRGRRQNEVLRGRRFLHGSLAFALVALLSATTIPSSLAQDAPNPPKLFDYRSDCENVQVADGWGRIGLPNFGAGESVVTSYAIDAWNKKRLFVTNGFEVFRSMNTGCSWEKVFALPEQVSQQNDYSQLDSRISQVVIPEGTTAKEIAYIVVDQHRPPEDLTRGFRTRVFRTENNGEDWVSADGELPEMIPPHGAPEQLLPTPAFPKDLYLLMETPDVQYMATSPDGGETWEVRGPVCVAPAVPDKIDTPVGGVEEVPGPGCVDPDAGTANAPEPSDTTGIAVDPFQPNDLWFYGPRGLERSLNSGQSPQPVEEVPEGVGAVDIFQVAGQDSRVVAAGAESPNLYVSQDGGETWENETAPGIVESLAKGRQAQEYVLATDLGVYLSVYGLQFSIGPSDRQVAQIKSARALGGSDSLCIFGSSIEFLEVSCAVEPPHEDPDPDPKEIPPYIPKDVDERPGFFNPENYKTTLDRGESEVVPYELQINKSPTPLDVYFLTDISGSMQNPIDGVARGLQSIINELAKRNVNTEFGLGVYRAYENPPAYDRRVDIEPPGEELARVLGNLIASSGGEETALDALYQSATGNGRDWAGNLLNVGQTRAYIPPDLQANFRPDALKVIIHAADEPFKIAPPRPSFDETIGALNAQNIEQVGLAIQDPGTGGSADEPEAAQTTPRSGLLRIAEGTDTAAAGRVDCDGDGVPDIFAGQPLVCDVDPDKAYKARLMSGAIVQLLDQMQQIGDVQLTVDAPAGVVPNIKTRYWTGIDFTDPTTLDFDVMFTCPVGTPEREFEVKFNAVAPHLNVLIAQTTATVTCTPDVAPKAPPPPKDPVELVEPDSALAPFFPIPAFVPPVVRPPEVSPNPGPQSQTQTQAQNQAQMQSAMAKQKQEQVQLALAYSQSVKAELAAERAGEDLNMSKYRSTSTRRHEQTPPGLILMLSASAMSMAFGLAARRYRNQPQPARRTRRFR